MRRLKILRAAAFWLAAIFASAFIYIALSVDATARGQQLSEVNTAWSWNR